MSNEFNSFEFLFFNDVKYVSSAVSASTSLSLPQRYDSNPLVKSVTTTQNSFGIVFCLESM